LTAIYLPTLLKIGIQMELDFQYLWLFVNTRKENGKKFSIIVAAEGAKPMDGEMVVERVIEGIATAEHGVARRRQEA